MLWDWIIDFRHWHTYSSSTHVIVVPSSKASYNWMMRGLCKPLIISISRSIFRRSSLHVHLTNLAAKRKPVVFSLHVYTVPYVPLFIFAFKKENNGKSFSFRYFFLFLFSPWKKPHYLPNSFFDISYVSFGSTFRWISTKRYGKHTSISAKKNKCIVILKVWKWCPDQFIFSLADFFLFAIACQITHRIIIFKFKILLFWIYNNKTMNMEIKTDANIFFFKFQTWLLILLFESSLLLVPSKTSDFARRATSSFGRIEWNWFWNSSNSHQFAHYNFY